VEEEVTATRYGRTSVLLLVGVLALLVVSIGAGAIVSYLVLRLTFALINVAATGRW
jgi:hypothetical protein